MTPSVHQRGTDYREYQTDADRWCVEKSESALLGTYPTGRAVAERFIAAAYRQGCSDAVIGHFERVLEGYE